MGQNLLGSCLIRASDALLKSPLVILSVAKNLVFSRAIKRDSSLRCEEPVLEQSEGFKMTSTEVFNRASIWQNELTTSVVRERPFRLL
jgi:hypothetical protein